MPHDTPLITMIVAGLVLAFILGAIANRLRMPPLVGYLLAGVAVGPFTPGLVADQKIASELAELGVILLMFGVGLHFSLKDLLSVRAVAIPGALLRIAGGTAMGLGLGVVMGWPIAGGLVFGLALSVASTVVLLKALQERHLLDSERGRIAVGWVIVEDLAMVLALVLIPAFAGVVTGQAVPTAPDPFVDLTESLTHLHLGLWGILGVTVVKLAAFVGFMLIVGRRVIPFILHYTAHTGSRELFRLAVLAIALGVAAGAAYLFGVSLALGAFFAGMILSESELSHRAAEESLPLRDAFSVLFFVSIGMLFDPSIIVRDPLPVLATVLIIIFGKSIVAFLVILAARKPASSALVISASLAQIGEFSFILAALGVGLGILPQQGSDLILAGAMISIVLNPIVVWLAESLRPRLDARAAATRTEPELGVVVPSETDLALGTTAAPPPSISEDDDEVIPPTRLKGHIVLIGFGRVGSVVGTELQRQGAQFLVIEDGEQRIAAARAAGIEVIPRNAATREMLTLANVVGAKAVLIAIPNAFEAGQATVHCRKLNPDIRIIARAHSDEEVDYLQKLGADKVIMGEREIGLGMIDWLSNAVPSAVTTPADLNPEVPKLAVGENLIAQVMAEQPPAPNWVEPATAPFPAQEETPVYTSPEEMPEPAPHEEGPAEPPIEVPSLGEMSEETVAPEPEPLPELTAPVADPFIVPPNLDRPQHIVTDDSPHERRWKTVEFLRVGAASAPPRPAAAPEPVPPVAPVGPSAPSPAPAPWPAASHPEPSPPAETPAPPVMAVPSEISVPPATDPVAETASTQMAAPSATAAPLPEMAAPPEMAPPAEWAAPGQSWQPPSPAERFEPAATVAPPQAPRPRLWPEARAATSDPEPQPEVPPTAPNPLPPQPVEDPVPVPQPIETPEPQEDPRPVWPPVRTPPQEDPIPTPQPIETPEPVEIPPYVPPAPTPGPGFPPPTPPQPPTAYGSFPPTVAVTPPRPVWSSEDLLPDPEAPSQPETAAVDAHREEPLTVVPRREPPRE